MSHLFISYRRTDSQDVVGRIYDRLTADFPRHRVFKDVDSIPIGVPFPDFLRGALEKTDAVLVVIGAQWLTITDSKGGRRLDDPEDFVRLEVQVALELGKAVLPVVVTNASHPTAEALPEAIRRLSVLNGIQVRPDPDFHRDMDRLVARLRELLGGAADEKPGDDLREARVSRLEQALRAVADIQMPRISEHPYGQKMRRSPHETLTEWYLATQDGFARFYPLFEANLFLLGAEVRGDLEGVARRIDGMKRLCRPVSPGSDDVGNPQIELATLQVTFRKLVYEAVQWELKALHGDRMDGGEGLGDYMHFRWDLHVAATGG
jgi:hypothetical protein